MLKFLFCKVAWKSCYQGEKGAYSQSAYVRKNKDGWEKNNFKPIDDRHYGYVQPSHDKVSTKMDITRLGAGKHDEKVDGITVIWIAPRYSGGLRVVGFYKNASVYRTHKQINGRYYRITAKTDDCFCLPEDNRESYHSQFMKKIRRAGVFYGYAPNKDTDFHNGLLHLLQNGKAEIKAKESKELHQASFRKYGKGGEKEEHKKLKKYARDNPQLFGMHKESVSKTEHLLPSGDLLDVLFQHDGTWTAVEVKSRRSDERDIRRGIYQCIKYRAVLEAMKKAHRKIKRVEVFLLLENKIIRTSHLKRLAQTLKVQIKIKK